MKRIALRSNPGRGLGWLVMVAFLALLGAASALSAQECLIVKGKGSDMIGRIEAALLKGAAPPCAAWKTLEISGDALADFAKVQQAAREVDIVVALGTDAAKGVRSLKKNRKVGLMIPNGLECACCMQVISLYPDLRQVYGYLKKRTFTSLVLVYTSETAEKAFHLSMTGREMGMDVTPVAVESPLDVPTRLRKGLDKAQGVLIAIDPKFFDEEFLKLMMDEIRRSGKPVFAFLKVFLDHGADVAFTVEEADMAREVMARLKEPPENGIFEVKSFFVKTGKSAKGDWTDEKIAQ